VVSIAAQRSDAQLEVEISGDQLVVERELIGRATDVVAARGHVVTRA
jgi:hypothetical protein